MENEITCPLCGITEEFSYDVSHNTMAKWAVNTLLEHFANECSMLTNEDLKADMFLRQFGFESTARDILTTRDTVSELEAKMLLTLIYNCFGADWIETNKV